MIVVPRFCFVLVLVFLRQVLLCSLAGLKFIIFLSAGPVLLLFCFVCFWCISLDTSTLRE